MPRLSYAQCSGRLIQDEDFSAAIDKLEDFNSLPFSYAQLPDVTLRVDYLLLLLNTSPVSSGGLSSSGSKISLKYLLPIIARVYHSRCL